MRFSVESVKFNSLIKRILLLTGSDPEAIISFVLKEKALGIYCHSKLEKGGNNLLYYEKIDIIGDLEEGHKSLYSNQLFTLKIPDNVENRYPNCKQVDLKFTDSILNISYDILWSKDSKPNNNVLNFPLLEKSVDLDIYPTFLVESKNKGILVNSLDIIEGISISSFIKSDVTSKESNGFLIRQLQDKLYLTSTDSTMAVCWNLPVLDQDTKDLFEVILSNPTLNTLKIFLSDSEKAWVLKHRQGLLIETENRRIILPIMKTEFPIEDILSFFNINKEDFIAELDLKPFLHTLGLISNNNTDLYKKIELHFKSPDGLSISTNINKADNIPCVVDSSVTIHINSDYLIVSSSKLSGLGYNANIFYDRDSSRVVLTSKDNRLVFLIQALSW